MTGISDGNGRRGDSEDIRFQRFVTPANFEWRPADWGEIIKKADVGENPKVFFHVGLLINAPAGILPACALFSHPKVPRGHFVLFITSRQQNHTFAPRGIQ